MFRFFVKQGRENRSVLSGRCGDAKKRLQPRRPPHRLREDEIIPHEGIPIVTPVRAILDAHAAGLGPALIGQAIADGQRLGVLTRTQAAQLTAGTAGAR